MVMGVLSGRINPGSIAGITIAAISIAPGEGWSWES
jgi:triphosphoribosyl-dephospho-CoA synthetase